MQLLPTRSLELWEIFALLFLLFWAASSCFGWLVTGSLCLVMGVVAEHTMNTVYKRKAMEESHSTAHN